MMYNPEDKTDYKYNFLCLCRKIDIVSKLFNENQNSNLEKNYKDEDVINLYIAKLNMILDSYNERNHTNSKKISISSNSFENTLWNTMKRMENIRNGVDGMF